MTRFFTSFIRLDSYSLSTYMLAFFFSAGLICGTYFFFRTDSIVISLMRVIPDGSVSIISLYLILFLPFLVSLVSCILDSVLVFPICFCRAFLFSYIHSGFVLCFPSTGWLMRWLVLFSDGMGLAVLYLFWQRQLRNRKDGISLLCLTASVLLLIGLFDFYIILPYYEAF